MMGFLNSAGFQIWAVLKIGAFKSGGFYHGGLIKSDGLLKFAWVLNMGGF